MINYAVINVKLADKIIEGLSVEQQRQILHSLLVRENCRKIDARVIPDEVENAVMCFFEDVNEERKFYLSCGLTEEECYIVMN